MDSENGLNLYDYDARLMDIVSGRFTSVDPMAEYYYSWSPYAYCTNNPINFNDPTGIFSTRTVIDVVRHPNRVSLGNALGTFYIIEIIQKLL